MADQDVHNFSSSSPHRLPTVSASQALHNISSTLRKPISTGLKGLDGLLQGGEYIVSSQDGLPGGISRGEITEVYGPPGVGKTAFALQLSASALQAGGSVVWVDTSYRLVGSRLNDMLCALSDDKNTTIPGSTPGAEPESKYLDAFHHFSAPTLPHLLALLTHPSNSFPPQDTHLLIVDSVSTLFALAFPKTAENVNRQQPSVKKSEAVQWAAGRRWAVMSDFISKVGKLAATRNIAILLIGQTTTRIRAETGAVLYPAVLGTAWDSGISNRIVLFRDWLIPSTQTSSQNESELDVRFAGVVKAKGVSHDGIGPLAMFRIEQGGLRDVQVDNASNTADRSPHQPAATLLKRKHDEVADSQSEEDEVGSDQEFGWGAEIEVINTEGLLE